MADQDKNMLALEICAPDRAPLKFEASEVTLPGSLGMFVVLPGHAPLLSTLDLGVGAAKLATGEERLFALSGGFAQVLDNRVLVLAQSAEMDDEIDAVRAEAARQRAEGRLKVKDNTDIDFARAECALKRAMIRLQTHGRSSTEGALAGPGITRK